MSGAPMEGKLEVHIFEGRNLPNRNRFGKQDSVVELAIGTTKKRTQVDKKGGANPRWNDRLYFTISGLGKTQLLVKALEMDSPSKFDDIGSCVVDLARIFEEEEVDGWYALKHKDRPAGSIYIEFTFTPKDGRKKPSKAALPEDDDLETIIPVAPKTSKQNEMLASAPSSSPGPNGPNASNRPHAPALEPSGSHTVPPGGMSSTGVRPSLSDLRPYSSASMYKPELATQYANKHGKKPLPVTPPVGCGNTGPPMAGNSVPTGMQPVQNYDMTLMPGQFVPMQQQQQQQQPVYVSGPPPVPQQYLPPPPQQGGTSMQPYPSTLPPQSVPQQIPIHMQGSQQHQQHQHQHQHQQHQQQQPQMLQQQHPQPALMNLFAPPGGELPVSKVLPQPPAPTPAFNPAFNPAFTNDKEKINTLPPASAKVLPVPPTLDNGRSNPGVITAEQTSGYSAQYEPPHTIQQQQQQLQPQPQMLQQQQPQGNPHTIGSTGGVMMSHQMTHMESMQPATGYSGAPQQMHPNGFAFQEAPGGAVLPQQQQQQQQQQQMYMYNQQMAMSQPQVMYGSMSSMPQPMTVAMQGQQQVVYSEYPPRQYQQQMAQSQPPGYQQEIGMEPTAPPLMTYESLQMSQPPPQQMYAPGNYYNNPTY
ncbi:hypothetical protein GQ54DRAFT_297195 [Martensiomyces pterosporus]|nr:hypothetical protein GQ54DRAFT_297195 [Martensiomyces pterosporus]